jgi:hypothetical protein
MLQQGQLSTASSTLLESAIVIVNVCVMLALLRQLALLGIRKVAEVVHGSPDVPITVGEVWQQARTAVGGKVMSLVRSRRVPEDVDVVEEPDEEEAEEEAASRAADPAP